MTNPSHEPEEQRPQKRVRIILPREVCTTPEETAKLLRRVIMDTLAELRAEEGDADRREEWDIPETMRACMGRSG